MEFQLIRWLVLLCYKELSPLRIPVMAGDREGMGDVEARIQTVEEIYRLVRAVVLPA